MLKAFLISKKNQNLIHKNTGQYHIILNFKIE